MSCWQKVIYEARPHGLYGKGNCTLDSIESKKVITRANMANGQKRLNESISKEQKYIKSREDKVLNFMICREKIFQNIY